MPLTPKSYINVALLKSLKDIVYFGLQPRGSFSSNKLFLLSLYD